VLAVGNATPSPGPVNLGNFRVGAQGAVTNLAVQNTTNVTGAEQLGIASAVATAGFAATNVVGSGLIAPGASQAGAVTVRASGSGTAGVNSGSVTIAYATDGTNVNAAFTRQAANQQVINLTATGFNVAAGSASPGPINLGNFRVGQAGGVAPQSQNVTVANTVAGPFTESLGIGSASVNNAAFTLTNNLGSGLIVAGGSNAAALNVARTGGAAGLNSGTLAIQYTSDGTGTSGLAAINANSQNITVNATGYQVAAGQLSTAPLSFGTVQVGQTVSQTLSISNIASGTAGFVEDLNARFGTATGTGAAQVSGAGQIAGLVAGATNSAAMVVSVNTSTAGTIAASIPVNFFSAGAVGGVSNGLGELGVGGANYGVSGIIQAGGQVINQASPVINTAQPINLGNVRIGAVSPTASLSVTNQATVAPQAALNASIAGNAPITAAGSFNLLAPGATNNTSLQVGMNTSQAGAINGTATVSFVSDASNVGNCAPNCQLTLASQNVQVTGGVYRLANPTGLTPSVTLAARVGDAVPAAAIGVTNASPDAFTEGLKATFTGAPVNVATQGSIGNLAAGLTDTTSMRVGLASTATAGTFAGPVQVRFDSTGAGTTGAADVQVGSSTVAFTGRVYTPAVGALDTGSVDFGIVRVGDAVAPRSVTVTNTAAASPLNDTLRASMGTASAGFTAAGSVGGLGAGASNAPGTLTVGVNTAVAGVFNGAAQVAFSSQNPDLADLALTGVSVGLDVQVNRLAHALLGQVGGDGTLSSAGNVFTLDLGSLLVGSGLLDSELFLQNLVADPADSLRGGFSLANVDDFQTSGFASLLELAPNQRQEGLMIAFNPLVEGLFEDTILFQGVSFNASDPAGLQLADITLRIRARVVRDAEVPEPATLALLALGLGLLFATRRRPHLRRVTLH
jgi:hypothetical protein